MSGETRVVDPMTGASKGAKLARFDLIPPEALHALAEHYGRGAQKYEERNWEKGYKWSLSFAALQRHAWAFWNREDTDPETGSCHMVAVMWHAAVMFTYWLRGMGTDDRPLFLALPSRLAPPTVSAEHDAIAETLDAKAGGTEPYKPPLSGLKCPYCSNVFMSVSALTYHGCRSRRQGGKY